MSNVDVPASSILFDVDADAGFVQNDSNSTDSTDSSNGSDNTLCACTELDRPNQESAILIDLRHMLETEPFIKSFEQIDSITEINGIPIDEIERRARPNAYSQSGFIGPDDKFADVLKADWVTVHKKRFEHQQLVSHIMNILKCAALSQPNPLDGTRLAYYSEILYKVKFDISPNYTHDIFRPNLMADTEVFTPARWNEKYSIKNTNNNTSIVINSGILSYIWYFGFYEGGPHNRHRVSPASIFRLLDV